MGASTDARDWRSWIRRNISQVQPLDGYAAKQCPVRTQLDVLRPGEKADVSDFLRSLADQGVGFEEVMFASISDDLDIGPIEAKDKAAAEAGTLAAMQRGDRVLLGSCLPTDLEGRRVGEPDILVRLGGAPVDGRWRYAPVDVKSHQILRPGKGAQVVVQTLQELAVPGNDAALSCDGRRDAKARDDTLQLAHYHRMLKACGHASDGPAWGGILGSEEQIVWFRLDQPLWYAPTSKTDRPMRTRSSLDLYDFKFAFRLDVASAALDHAADSSKRLLVKPMKCSECPGCPWRNHCWPQLNEEGDVSLLPGVTYDTWRSLREAGLGTSVALAASTVDAVNDVTDDKFADIRLQARARIGEAPAYIRPAANPVVPHADVEVDVDMENVASGAYLWGATVTVRREGLEGIEPGHHAFSVWADPLDDDAVASCFLEFWSFLSATRQACADQVASFAAFCWSASAENRFLRLGGDLTDQSDEVEDFIASSQWVDLLAWYRANFVTGHGMGLKIVAGLHGFAWRDEDPGGAASMTWHQDAVGPDAEVGEAARARLIAYNEDDVRATLAIREAIKAGSWSRIPTP